MIPSFSAHRRTIWSRPSDRILVTRAKEVKRGFSLDVDLAGTEILGGVRSCLRNPKGDTSFDDMLKMIGGKPRELSARNLDSMQHYEERTRSLSPLFRTTA